MNIYQQPHLRALFLTFIFIVAFYMAGHALGFFFPNLWGSVAISSWKGVDFMAMKARFVDLDLWIISFRGHIIFGSIGIVLGALQFSKFLTTRFKNMHRTIGSIYIFSILISSFLSFILSFYVEVTPIENWKWYAGKVAFGMGAVVWFTSTLLAIYYVIKKQFAKHKDWVIRSYACTLVVVTFRFMFQFMYTGLDWNFTDSYLIGVFLCVPTNLIIAQIIISKPTFNIQALKDSYAIVIQQNKFRTPTLVTAIARSTK